VPGLFSKLRDHADGKECVLMKFLLCILFILLLILSSPLSVQA